MHTARASFIAVFALLLSAFNSRADVWQQLLDHGAEVYYADAGLRAAFATANPADLPESKRKTPAPSDSAFDWSKVVKSGHLLTQKDSLNCWAYAAVTALEWSWAIRNGTSRLPDLALQPTIDRVGKNGTGYAGWALEDLLKHGTCLAKFYPHVGTPATLRRDVKTPYRAIAWGLVDPRGKVPTVDQLKKALVDFGPLVANVYVTPAFHSYKGGVFAEHAKPRPGESETTHIVVIVGWDDRKGREGCWKVQNSWGPGWGDGGFMWIEYGSNNIGHSACWVLAQSNQYDLPEGIQRSVGPDAAPFPHWPDAKRISPANPRNTPVLSAAEAPKHVGERAVIELTVNGGDVHSFDGHAELFSKSSWRSEGCVIVRILKSALGNFPSRDARITVNHYRGKTIRVRGTIQPNPVVGPGRPLIEVNDPAQITVVKERP